jgi:hypothetical protein
MILRQLRLGSAAVFHARRARRSLSLRYGSVARCRGVCCAAILLAACSGAAGNSSGSGANGKTAARGTAAAGSSSGAAGSHGNGLYAACTATGTTRSCCGRGTQTCSGTVEFANWGPCLDAKGAALTCSDPCATNEFGPGCDAGIFDSGTGCRPGEFGPACDGGGPPPPSLCTDKTINNEPEILAAYSPASGQSVAQNGQIKVWITDEAAAIIAPNESIDPNTGLIAAPGNRAAKAPDNYLWEPALYIAPQTAENGGTPHFPQWIKGWYNNNPPLNGGKPAKGAGVQVPGMDAPPPGTNLSEKFNSEDIWDVSALGLAPGTYTAEFVIHDGDTDRGVGCITIVIAP